MKNALPKTTKAQTEALRFLARGGEQIKIRTARPLIAAGLITTDRTAEQINADAAAGGWVRASITDKGREVVA